MTEEPDDSPRASPLVRRLELAAMWKKVRTDKGWTLADVAAKLGYSPAKAHRFEAGTTLPREQDVRMLFEELGQRKKIKYAVSVLDEAAQTGWWERYAINPDYQRYIGLEDGASSIHIVEPTWLPALVQTPEYARVIWDLWPIPDTEKHSRERVLAVRQTLLDRPNAPEVRIVVDESVLRRPTGGAQVMAPQLRAVQQLMEQGKVKFRVIPESHGAHRGLQGSFILLSLPVEALSDTVYMDLPTQQLFENDDSSLTEYASRFEELWRISTERVTRDLVAKYIQRHSEATEHPTHRTRPA